MTCATGCKCEKPDNGETIFCDRHQVEKSLALWERCCERTKWWRSWEERRGPGQVAPPEGTSRQTRSGGGCGGKKTARKIDPDRYSDNYDDPTEIIKLCDICQHYNADTEHCEQAECRRLRAKTCLERIADPRQKCPEGKW